MINARDKNTLKLITIYAHEGKKIFGRRQTRLDLETKFRREKFSIFDSRRFLSPLA